MVIRNVYTKLGLNNRICESFSLKNKYAKYCLRIIIVKMNDDEKFIKNIFEHYNMPFTKIKESTSKSPDFIYNGENETILFELKSKYDDPKLLKKRKDEIERENLYQHVDVLEYSNTYSSITNKAYNQLRDNKVKLNADLCFIIFYAKEPNSHDKMEKYIITLYGKKFIIPQPMPEFNAKYCYFYEYSDFMRFKDIIDGAVITNGRNLNVCINPISKNYEMVKKSKLVNIFKEGVLDPKDLIKKNKIHILPESIDRSRKSEIKKYIKEKYGIENYIEADFPSYTYESRIDV